jgi:8-oxo-dGTP pyrophosphatase MutT (NUDIX family)
VSTQALTPVTPVPSAAVVLLRASSTGFETLLVRRNPQLAFHGGAFVFPGGRIEREELAHGASEQAAARVAAVREVHEETAVHVPIDALRALSCWTTPEESPRRFRAWFFMAHAQDEAHVQVDGGEIHGFQWMTPEHALAAGARNEIELPPAVFVTLTLLAQASELSQALALCDGDVTIYEPRSVFIPEGRVALYQRDAGYASRTLEAPGARDRLWALETGMRYELRHV